MKNVLSICKVMLLLLVVAGLQLSCSKKKDTPAPDDEPFVAAVGTPNGPATSKLITAKDGGTIVSADGKLTITIPADALASDQTITIQPVINTNPIGNNQSYKLTPEGTEFSKPITLTLDLSDVETEEMFDALGVAYQSADGIWNATGDIDIDKVNKKAIVTTTHFSSWSRYYPVSTQLEIFEGGIKTFKLYADNNVFIRPLKGTTKKIRNPKEILRSPIRNIEVPLGAAGLNADGTVTYHAPTEVDGTKHTRIKFTLQGLTPEGIVYAYVPVTIYDNDFYVEVKGATTISKHLDGATGAWYFTRNNYTRISGIDATGNYKVEIEYPGKEIGDYTWNFNSPLVTLSFTVGDTAPVDVYRESYVHVLPNNSTIREVGPTGSLKINTYEGVGGIVHGTFSIPYAGKDGTREPQAVVEGHFTVVRQPDVK